MSTVLLVTLSVRLVPYGRPAVSKKDRAKIQHRVFLTEHER